LENNTGEGKMRQKNEIKLDGVSALYLTMSGAGIELKRKKHAIKISENSLLKAIRKLYKGRD
jgi:hypothetical protein